MVSVIIPNYNHAAFLRQRIETVLGQSYQDLEIILLDDASTDNSVQIMQEFEHHPKVSALIVNGENSGNTMRQWRKGLERATGHWIWFAESDDYSDPEFLQASVQATQLASSAVMVATHSRVVKESAVSNENLDLPNNLLGFHRGDEVNSNYLVYENPFKNASALLISRHALLQLGWEDLSHFQWTGDWKMYSGLLRQGDFYGVDRHLNYYRRHGNATSNSRYDKGFLFKEGLPLTLALLNHYECGFRPRLKHVLVWSRHLLNKYRADWQQRKFRFYIFRPFTFCILLYLVLPMVALKKLLTKQRR